MLHAPRYYDNAGSGSTSTLLLLVVSLLFLCCFDVRLASPTTVYDSFLPNNELPGADVRREVVRPGENEQQPQLPPPHPPVQQQLLGSAAAAGGSVTWVPWYGLTEPADIVLLAGLLTVAVLGVFVFAVLVFNLRAKLRQTVRDREESGSEERLRLRAGTGLAATDRFGLLELSVAGKVAGSESVSKVREPAQGIVLIETVKPVPVSCVAVKRNCGREDPPPSDCRDGPYRGGKRIEQQLSLSDKQLPGTVGTQRKRHIPPEAVTMSAIGTTLESTNQLPSPVPPPITAAAAAAAAAEAIATTVSLVGDDKEHCLQQLQPISDDNSLQSQQPQQQQQTRNQRNVLKRQPVAEISLTGPLSSVSSPNAAYIQLLTPSSASSLSSSATTTDNNATPTKTGSGGPLSAADGPMAARFGFSPRSIHSFPVPTATYFRFPDVDDFTPTPRTIVKPSAIGDGDSSSTPPAVDAFSDPSERDPVVIPPPKKSTPPLAVQPTSVAELRTTQPASPSVEPPAVEQDEPKNEEKEPTVEEATTTKEKPREEVRSTARMCAPMANRRVRLKSISLDSEGARLVEENLTSTIPVQELVGIAQQRGKGSGGGSGPGSTGRRFDCVLDDDEDVVDDDDDDDDDDREHNYETDSGADRRWPARTKRVRNILNLRLNIPPLGSTPVGSQSTGSMVLDQDTATMTVRPVATSVSNPAMYPAPMAAHQQHHHQSNLLPSRYLGQEEASEQFYFEYFDYGDDDDDDEEDDDETGDEYEGEDGRERFAESEDNNNNSSNSGSGNNNNHHSFNHNNNSGGQRSRPALPPAPKTPTLSQSKQKASSLDSDSKVKIYIPYGVSTGSVSCSGGLSVMSIAQSQPQGMATTHNTYAHQSHHQHQHHQPVGPAPSSHQTPYGHHQQQQQQQQQLQPRRVSSASVPTTPKRYQYRSAIGHSYYHHHSQHHHPQHYQSQGQSKLKAAFGGDQGTMMRKDKSVIGLNNSSSSSTTVGTEEGKGQAGASTTTTTTTTGRSSILQRRGSNHSLTLNLDIYHRGGSVDLTGSNCSLQQHRGSYKNLHQAHSQSQLYQQYPDTGTTAVDRGTVRVQCHQASPQGGGGSTVGEATGNGATTGAGAAPANNTTNNNNNNSKKNLLQRRGSNTSLTLNLRSGVVGGGGGGGGSTFGLNRFSSHNSLHTTHMSALGTGTGSYLQQQQQLQTAGHGQHGQQHGQYGQSGSGLVRPAGSRKSLLERRNSNASLTLINVHQRTLSVSNCNLRSGSICSLNSLLTTHTQNEAGGGAGGVMMLEEDELDCTGAAGSGEHDNGHDYHHHHHHHHQHHQHHHQHHQQGLCHRHRAVGAGGRHGGSIDGGIDGTIDAVVAGRSELAGEAGAATGGQGRCGRSMGRLTIAMAQGTSMDIAGSTGEPEVGRGGVAGGDYQRHGRQRKFRSSDSLHNINAREQGLQSSCLAVQRDTNLGHHHHQEQLTEAKLMACGGRYEDRHHYGSSENFKQPSNRLSTHRALFHKDPSTVTSASSANNLSALGTGSQCCCCCCCCYCCCGHHHGGGVHGGVGGDGCCDGNGGGLIVKTGNLSISNSNIRNISTKPLSPQTTSEDFKIYLANIQFLQNASNVLTIAYLRKLHNFFSKTYRKMVSATAASSTHQPSPDQSTRRKHSSSKEPPPLPSPPVTDKPLETNRQTEPETGGGEACSTKMMLLHSDSLHHPPVCDDESYDEEHKKMVLKIHQEFWDLPTNYQEKPLVFGSQAKNRYKTILPNEHSRVILSPERASTVTSEPYINANYIKGPDYANNSYIATQGPLPNTIYEFWLMVHQNIVRTAAAAAAATTTTTAPTACSTDLEQKIVMLTNFVENGRQKCAIYFPQNVGEWLAFGCTADVDVSGVLEEKDAIKQATGGGPMAVRCASSFFLVQNIILEQRNGYTVRTLSVIYGSRERPESASVKPPTAADGTTSSSSSTAAASAIAASFDLIHFRAQHYWFPDWPDHRSPNDINVLLDLSLDVLGSNVRAPGSTGDLPETPGASSPAVDVLPIIHCSAGIGRTGCLIAILNGLRQLRLSVMSHRKRRVRSDIQADASSLLAVAAAPSLSTEQPKDTNPDDPGGADDASGFSVDDDGSLEPSIPLPPVPSGRGNGSKAAVCNSGGNGRSGGGSGASSLSREIGQVDILGIVCNLRLQRGGMVQNSEQYELIHRALCLYLEKLTQEKRSAHGDSDGLGGKSST